MVFASFWSIMSSSGISRYPKKKYEGPMSYMSYISRYKDDRDHFLQMTHRKLISLVEQGLRNMAGTPDGRFREADIYRVLQELDKDDPRGGSIRLTSKAKIWCDHLDPAALAEMLVDFCLGAAIVAAERA